MNGFWLVFLFFLTSPARAQPFWCKVPYDDDPEGILCENWVVNGSAVCDLFPSQPECNGQSCLIFSDESDTACLYFDLDANATALELDSAAALVTADNSSIKLRAVVDDAAYTTGEEGTDHVNMTFAIPYALGENFTIVYSLVNVSDFLFAGLREMCIRPKLPGIKYVSRAEVRALMHGGGGCHRRTRSRSRSRRSRSRSRRSKSKSRRSRSTSRRSKSKSRRSRSTSKRSRSRSRSRSTSKRSRTRSISKRSRSRSTSKRSRSLSVSKRSRSRSASKRSRSLSVSKRSKSKSTSQRSRSRSTSKQSRSNSQSKSASVSKSQSQSAGCAVAIAPYSDQTILSAGFDACIWQDVYETAPVTNNLDFQPRVGVSIVLSNSSLPPNLIFLYNNVTSQGVAPSVVYTTFCNVAQPAFSNLQIQPASCDFVRVNATLLPPPPGALSLSIIFVNQAAALFFETERTCGSTGPSCICSTCGVY